MTSEDFQSKFNEAWLLRSQGKHDDVLSIANEYLTKTKERNDKASEALFLKLYAQSYSDLGKLKEALSYYKQIERLYIDLKEDALQMHTLRHIGGLYHQLGEFECAQKCLVQVIEFHQNSNSSEMEVANAHRIYAIVLGALQRIEEAMSYWKMARDTYRKFNITERVRECQKQIDQLISD